MMIFFILYALFGVQTAYITGAVMTVKETDFGRDDLLVWFVLWPIILVGHFVAWLVVKDEK